MKRTEIIKILAGLGLRLPVITNKIIPEEIFFISTQYDQDAEDVIGAFERSRKVSTKEKTAIRYFIKETKDTGHWRRRNYTDPVTGKRTSDINLY